MAVEAIDRGNTVQLLEIPAVKTASYLDVLRRFKMGEEKYRRGSLVQLFRWSRSNERRGRYAWLCYGDQTS